MFVRVVTNITGVGARSGLDLRRRQMV